MSDIVDIADLDVIYLTYNEPQADEFWSKISAHVPWAKRVDGVKGSDAAHKACAEESETDRFIVIDGDNLPDWNFFDESLVLDDTNRNVVFRWKARNIINGLEYGNGGLSCWTKEFVQNMRTHEASDGSPDTNIEFCYHPDYWAMHDVWSTTYPNGDAYQAFRAGFREGVKLCLDRGERVSPMEFYDRIHPENIRRLSVWHNIGYDVRFGEFAIGAARIGTAITMFEDFDITKVRDVDYIDELADTYKDIGGQEFHYGEMLSHKLGLPILQVPMPQGDFCNFFKKTLPIRKNKGIMIRE